MKKHTKIMPMLPDFYAPKRGRKSRIPQQIFAARLASIKEKTFKQLGEIFSPFLPMAALRQEQAGAMSRRRIFTKEIKPNLAIPDLSAYNTLNRQC
jgi:hypothetical protein